jgi:hypothetical protein
MQATVAINESGDSLSCLRFVLPAWFSGLPVGEEWGRVDYSALGMVPLVVTPAVMTEA